jgi:hypothetical protein
MSGELIGRAALGDIEESSLHCAVGMTVLGWGR